MYRDDRAARVRSTNEEDICRLTGLAEERRGDIEIVDPWSDRFSPSERAWIHCGLIGSAYAGGHALSRGRDPQSVRTAVTNGTFLCWIALWRNEPVGTSAIKLTPDGIAYLVQSGELRSGSPLSDGSLYDGGLHLSTLMYRRCADFLGRLSTAADVFALQGDVQMFAARTLPGGGDLQRGSRTQHVNYKCGLRPFLLCVPRLALHPGGAQDVQLICRRYVLRDELDLCPLFTPSIDFGGRVTCAEIARATFPLAFGLNPVIDEAGDESGALEPRCDLSVRPEQDSAVLIVAGAPSRADIGEAIVKGLASSRFVEVVVPNHPANVAVQTDLLDMGLTALGAMPGVRVGGSSVARVVPTTFHYGALREDLRANLADVELARDFDGTPLWNLVTRLMAEWRTVDRMN